MFSCLCLTVLITWEYYRHNRSNHIYDNLRTQYYNKTEEENIDEYLKGENDDGLEKQYKNYDANQAVKELIHDIENIIGWISIPGTKIDYPVVQYSDNSYYLDHNCLGEKDVKGAIFMDYRNDYQGKDSNYILYGHKMADGTMFSDLNQYVQESTSKTYFNDYNIIKYDTSHKNTQWKVFSVYVVDLDKEKYYLYTKYDTDDEFREFIKEVKERSLIKNELKIDSNDEILTLVTCNYWFNNARTIIHAVRLQ